MNNHITIPRNLVLVQLQHLQALLRHPSFGLDQPAMLAAAESLWLGARIARLLDQRRAA